MTAELWGLQRGGGVLSATALGYGEVVSGIDAKSRALLEAPQSSSGTRSGKVQGNIFRRKRKRGDIF
jgi:hypothetical protein